jgi:hypothetical protein
LLNVEYVNCFGKVLKNIISVFIWTLLSLVCGSDVPNHVLFYVGVKLLSLILRGERDTLWARGIKVLQILVDFKKRSFLDGGDYYVMTSLTFHNTVEPLLSGLRLTVNSINRSSHRYAVPLHFQCAGGVLSG